MARDASLRNSTELRELLINTKVVRGNMKLPSPDALGRLWAWIYGFEVDARQADASRRELVGHFDGIIDLIPSFAKELEVEKSAPKNLLVGPEWRRMEGDYAALNRLLAAIQEIQSREFFQAYAPLGAMQASRKGGGRWHRYASTLATEFIKAMKETNPANPLGISNEGPVTRFIAAVIPFITGEHPKLAAIAQHLRRHP